MDARPGELERGNVDLNPPPFHRDYTRDPNIKALKRRWLINNHGSTLSSVACQGMGRLIRKTQTWKVSEGQSCKMNLPWGTKYMSYSQNSLKGVIKGLYI